MKGTSLSFTTVVLLQSQSLHCMQHRLSQPACSRASLNCTDRGELLGSPILSFPVPRRCSSTKMATASSWAGKKHRVYLVLTPSNGAYSSVSSRQPWCVSLDVHPLLSGPIFKETCVMSPMLGGSQAGVFSTPEHNLPHFILILHHLVLCLASTRPAPALGWH